MRVSLITILALASVFISSSVTAQAPDSLSFHGLLTDSLGNPVDSNGVGMTFTLYKAGSAVWTEPQSVDVKAGVFNVLLGKVTDLSTLAFDQPMDLGIKLDNEASEMSPRTPLAAAAYAKALPGLYTFYRDDGTNQSYNVVGGAANNVVGAGVTGATIGGGGGGIGITSVPNSVLGSFGTVGGGLLNVANGPWATVGGGRSNAALSSRATVGGGEWNRAIDVAATVGGGGSNLASNIWATIGGGGSNLASGSYATVGGGESNGASGDWATVGGGGLNRAGGLDATVPGGHANSARGRTSFAAGHAAKAIHNGTFVWNDRSLTSGNDSLVSTLENQFLIRADNGVGIGTASPAGNVHIADAGDAVFILEADTGDTDEGNNPLFRMYQDGRKVGMNIGFDNTSFGSNKFGFGRRWDFTDFFDTVVIETNTGDVGVGTNSPSSRLHVVDNLNGNGGATSSYVTHLANSSAGNSPDVLALSVGRVNPGSAVNFVGFFADGTLIGQIEGAGNAVSYNTTGADYAEYIRKLDPDETINVGSVVGLFEGGISYKTSRALRAMVITGRAGVVGNMPRGGDATGFEKVSFMGQVSVLVRGPVQAGDYVVTSGLDDGMGVAVSADRLELKQLSSIVGRAWESKATPETGRVLIEVGLDRADVLAVIVQTQTDQITLQTDQITRLEKTVARLESVMGTN
ncbi:MAG: hypothetical protein ACC655_01415 [Rhodothermia bacterium]